MQNAAGGTTDANLEKTYRSVVTDLMLLMEHVETAIRQVELAMACAHSIGDSQTQDDVVVLDDVMPGYVRADAALHACRAKLGAALHLLLN